jgi:hypothetical protein
MRLEVNLERIQENLAADLCTPTQNPRPLKSSGTLLQTILHVCNDWLVG